VEEPDPDGEDDVEAAIAQVEVLQLPDQELGSPRRDVTGVAARSGLDHLLRAVDGRQAASVEALADERCGDAVPAADLEHTVVGTDAEVVDDLL
jgi:hypothetical protein